MSVANETPRKLNTRWLALSERHKMLTCDGTSACTGSVPNPLVANTQVRPYNVVLLK